jgi:RecA-family ATPase
MRRREMPTSPAFLADILLPSHEVHLLGGPSGAGKTRWLLHTLLQWEAGEDFLAFHSHPVPWIYVAADRSITSVERTLTGMGIDPKRIPKIPAWDTQMGLAEIFDKIQASKAQFVIWESFGSFVDPPAHGKMVKEFINRTAVFCQRHDTTVLGVMESPKMKPYERYENPRQRISGVAAWGHFSETIFLVEPEDVEDPHNPYRNLWVCPRNGPGMKVDLCFDLSGRLLPYQRDSASEVVEKVKKRRK